MTSPEPKIDMGDYWLQVADDPAASDTPRPRYAECWMCHQPVDRDHPAWLPGYPGSRLACDTHRQFGNEGQA